MEDSADNKKRVRDDSDELESNSPESKRVHTNTCPSPDESESDRVNLKPDSDSPEFSETQNEPEEANSPEWNLIESENEFDSPEARKIPQDILDILDDSETMPAIQGLDSVMRSFEEEILQSSLSPAQPAIVELTSDSGESQPDLGYLLEASDDELGLPPTISSSEDKAQNNVIDAPAEDAEALVGLGNIVGFEDGLNNYEVFELGLSERAVEGGNYPGTGDFVTVDRLFDYSEPSEFSDFTWRPESLPAL